MRRRYWIASVLGLFLLVLATVGCGRLSQGKSSLIPTFGPDSASTKDTPTSLPSNTPTPTASPMPTPTPTPTATPTPTPLPAVLIERAQVALHNGDYAAAQAVYEALLPEQLDESEAALTRFGLAQSLLQNEAYAEAIHTLRELIADYPAQSLVPDAHFLMAEALVADGQYLAAVDAYRAYLAEREVIAPYVQMWIGDAYTFTGVYNKAVEAYQEGLLHAPSATVVLELREKLALAHNYSGDHASALVQYDTILANTDDTLLQARIQYQAAQTLLAAGEREAAYTRLYDLVNNYAETGAAYDALVDLLNSNQAVDDFQRGLVDFYNDMFDPAVASFYRVVEADLEGHVGAPHYFAGLAYRSTGNYAAALVEFDTLIDTHPGDPYEDDAWLDKAWTHYLAGDAASAVATYTQFAARNGSHSLAATALWWAGNIHFWADDCAEAEPLFTQLASDYPTSENAPDALYRAAFCHYRLEHFLEAEEAWRTFSASYPDNDLAAGAHFWRGRSLLAAGETISATGAFNQAVDAGPLDYYSQRALDYLAAGQESPARPREPFASVPLDVADLEPDEEVERAAADGWLAGWLGLSHTEALTVSQLSPALAGDSRLLRADELWRLGRKSEAKTELESLRRDTATDLRAQYELAIFFRDLGLYRSSILAANAAILLSPADSPFDAPDFLARLAYPTYFDDLVLPEAQANGLDPLLLFALIRQESLFEGFATSYAYAYGLMQIIPSTGQSIANSLGWPGYDTSDLYRPYISVKFGSWYLARQRDTFDGLIYPALAAYNGGPGNAQRWLEQTMAGCTPAAGPDACPFDYDVYVELINLYETRLYIRQIYKHYSVYQHLYSGE